MIEMWICPKCDQPNAIGKQSCRCGQEKVEYTTDGSSITPKKKAKASSPVTSVGGDNFLTKEAKRQHANRNNRVVNKIKPGTEDQFFTSTMPK